MTPQQKDRIDAKISEALSASLGDWGDKMKQERPAWFDEMMEQRNEQRVKWLDDFFAAEKAKLESEIKSALETIDWDNE